MTRSSLTLALLGSTLFALPASAQDGPTTRPAKKKVKKTFAVVGKQAPDFVLTDLSGKRHRLSDYLKQKKVVVLEWFNPGCPYVKRHHEANRTMAETYAKYAKQDVVWLAINSGAKGKQGHGKQKNKNAQAKWKIAYPILIDERGVVGRTYKARTTPHMYVINKQGLLVYAGAIDNRQTPATPEHVNYVDLALTSVLAGQAVAKSKTKPYGCSVKYGPLPAVKMKLLELTDEQREAILKRLKERRKRLLEEKRKREEKEKAEKKKKGVDF